jgi:hypothetical protein
VRSFRPATRKSLRVSRRYTHQFSYELPQGQVAHVFIMSDIKPGELPGSDGDILPTAPLAADFNAFQRRCIKEKTCRRPEKRNSQGRRTLGQVAHVFIMSDIKPGELPGSDGDILPTAGLM